MVERLHFQLSVRRCMNISVVLRWLLPLPSPSILFFVDNLGVQVMAFTPDEFPIFDFFKNGNWK